MRLATEREEVCSRKRQPMTCSICEDSGTVQTNYDPTGVCTTYGPCRCEAGRRVLESDNAILKKLVNKRTEQIHELRAAAQTIVDTIEKPADPATDYLAIVNPHAAMKKAKT
jgi:hypothetical protein